MPLFKCSKCGCVDNSALGFYWDKHFSKRYKWPEELKPYYGKPLCCECAPQFFIDGTKTEYGKWHGKFEKLHYDKHNKETQDDIKRTDLMFN